MGRLCQDRRAQGTTAKRRELVVRPRSSRLRTVYLRGPIGVSKLRTKYGGIKNRGVKPNAFRRGSGSVIRNVLQQLEQSGLIKQGERGAHKGRIVTPAGASMLFKAAKRLEPSKQPVKKEAAAKKPAKEKKTEEKAGKDAEKKE